MAYRNKSKRKICMDIPSNLHAMLRRLAIDNESSMVEIVIQYLEYLQAQEFRKRKTLNEKSKPEFELEDR